MISCFQRIRYILAIAVVAIAASAQTQAPPRRITEEIRRINAAARVLEGLMATPGKGVPEEVLAAVKCVAVVPSMTRGGFLVGEKFGKGVATCRTSKGWSGPAPFTITGGSWGLQFGGEAVDLLMLVMNEKGTRALQANKLQLGTVGSVAAGPVGRQVDTAIDWKERSEVLTYSRTRDRFTGIELNGAVVKQDEEETRALYGKAVPLRAILAGKIAPPEGTESFLSAVQKYAQSGGTTSTESSTETRKLARLD
jgi:lipid-binding SYLF domain-containing protein